MLAVPIPRDRAATTSRPVESYGFLSTYPPTQCGLATFSWSLASALRECSGSATVGVVEVVERPDGVSCPEVVHRLLTDQASGGGLAPLAAAEALNRFDVAIIQHEFGIYAGRDGESLIDILRHVHVPTIVVLHTVLVDPTDHQRRVLEQVVQAASAVVVMTETARERLLAGYFLGTAELALIAHGAPTDWASTEPRLGATGFPPTLLTWGLLGPGKGIEWAIEALAELQDLDPPPRYIVVGETHPHVLEQAGEGYRTMLQDRARDLGVGSRVHFDGRYLDRPRLRELVRAADVVVLPYDSTDQVTSGVLIEAVTARRPVVATSFPHAVELLSTGAGEVVGHRDPAAIAKAVRRILTEPGVATTMVDAARELVPDLTWAAVAERYRDLARSLLPDPATVVV